MEPTYRRRSIVREPGPPPALSPLGIALRIAGIAVVVADALYAALAPSDSPHHAAITAALALGTVVVIVTLMARRLAAGDQEERGSWSRRRR